MKQLGLKNIICELPLVYFVELDEIPGLELQVSNCSCSVQHLYRPVTDIAEYHVTVRAPNVWDMMTAIAHFNQDLGTANYEDNVPARVTENEFTTTHVWQAHCRCRPQSQYHFLLENEVVDDIYAMCKLRRQQYRLCDRLLCLGRKASPNQLYQTRRNCDISEEDWDFCHIVALTVVNECKKAREGRENNP